MKCAVIREANKPFYEDDLKSIGCEDVEYFNVTVKDSKDLLLEILDKGGFDVIVLGVPDMCLISLSIQRGLEVYILEYSNSEYLGLSKVLGVKVLKEPITRYAGL